MPRSPAAPTDLIQCVAAGMTQAEAAQALGVSRRSVCRYAAKLGLTFAKYKLTRADVWAEAAKKGMTVAEAAEALGVSKTAAYMAGKRYGLEFRPGPRGRPDRLPEFKGRDGWTYRELRKAKIPREEALRVLGYGASDGPR